jgi:CRISPR type IV-associated protein Csf3
MAYRDGFNLEPVQITAHLRTAVVADQWLPIDGVLLYQVHRDQEGPQDITIPGAYSCNGVSTLPLDIVDPGSPTWFYRASWAEWGPYADGKDFWTKHFDNDKADLIDFGGKRGKVIIESGQYKAYHVPIYYRSALWVKWYCVGDLREIRDLLLCVTNIGKKTTQGWGRVAEWDIAPIDNDYSIEKDGRLMRGVPAGMPIDGRVYIGQVGNYGIRPSYWYRDNQTQAVLPDA